MITGQVAVSGRGEPFTRRELQDWIDARAMNVFRTRLDQMIEAARTELETAGSIKQMRVAQGALKALRRAKQLPEIMLGELTKAGK